MVPIWNVSETMPRHHPPSGIFAWLSRWLIARIMLGAGLIKVFGTARYRSLSWLVLSTNTLTAWVLGIGRSIAVRRVGVI
jgi:hypothetical protein